MSWLLPAAALIVLGLVVLARIARRNEKQRMLRGIEERDRARERGSDRARLQHPVIDLEECIGCGLCVAACPEEQVLDLIHGQAHVVHGSRCVGHGKCAAECPVGAIAVTIADLETRKDIPVLSDKFEAATSPGLFLAGELTGFALIKTAISHGTAVADEVANRKSTGKWQENGAVDLCIVGAGPAGIACSLEAKRRELAFVTLDQEQLGGAVATYPRRKLVMTQPVDLPLAGRMKRRSYSKEELMEMWSNLAKEHELPVRPGVRFTGLEQEPGGKYVVKTTDGDVIAHNVCLALGRRGTPRKLGVPGEDLSKVAYALMDAASYTAREILVVGGGDSAIEAAVGLGEQPGNKVTLSYRKSAFTRIKARNERRIERASREGHVHLLFDSQVREITSDKVRLSIGDDGEVELGNDDVFIMVGGIPPFELLRESGVSFDQKDRPQTVGVVETSSGLRRALGIALFLAVCLGVWVGAFLEYYRLPLADRPLEELHWLLKPSGVAGLAFGVTACFLIATNLSYLVRRSPKNNFELGSLRTWMIVHVATGISAVLIVLVHSGLSPRDTTGGHAFLGLALLAVTGAIGRYFYSFLPRAASGRMLQLDEVKKRLAALTTGWNEGGDFGERARAATMELIKGRAWRGSFWARVLSLLTSEMRLKRMLGELRAEGHALGVSAQELDEMMQLVRSAHRTALVASHYEDLRSLLASWRWFHRWVALLMVILVVAHVVTAVYFGDVLPDGWRK